MFKINKIFLLALLCLQSALSEPVVTLNSDEEISGTTSKNGVEAFKGIPFAEPPLGDLRFARPVPYTKSLNGFQATDVSPSCLIINPKRIIDIIDQISSPINPLINQISPILGNLLTQVNTDEDCLYLNVYRPEGTKAGDKLPVMVWIYGGGFLFGTGTMYDGSKYVAASERINQPIVVVTFNYRMGPYGFLGGSAVQAEDNGNPALLDQRLALKWVQKHINNFGGDPDKVTIFGESAGAMSVFAQMVAYDGDHTNNGKPLFRAAIMQSGTSTPIGHITDEKPQKMFNRFAGMAGCGGLDDAETMSCLRGKPIDTLISAQNSYSINERFGFTDMMLGFSPHADGSFLSDTTKNLMDAGKIAPIPFIAGNQEDEGTLFGILYDSQNEDEFQEFLSSNLPNATDSDKETLSELYPQDPAEGSPFRTGFLNQATPQFKRVSALFGDLVFQQGRRDLLSQSNVDRWNYHSTALHNMVPILGTFHANDLVWQWNLDLGPYRAYQDYFIAFANTLNPNTGISLPKWPKYTKKGKETLEIGLTRFGRTTDTYREKQMQFMIDNPDAVEI